MRRAPAVTLCAAAALVAAGLVPSAGAQPAGPSIPEPPGAAAAARTLDAVQSALTGDGPPGPPDPAAQPRGGRDLTLLLRDLRLQLPALRGEDRERAEGWLARPTDGAADPEGHGYEARAENDCGQGEPGAGTKFCIHWVKTSSDAPPPADTNPANGIPDQVDRTRATMRRVWAREIVDAGFKEPLKDAGPPDAGPNDELDIYLSNVGPLLYGYCSSEPAPGSGRDSAAYCVLDDDYSSSQFPAETPLENLQVTVAHEFFHAVQFAYDAFEDRWFMEGTATWMEDEVFDGVDDNHYYLDWSPLSRPERPLDLSRDLWVYGSWLWFRHLGEQHPADRGTGIPTIIRRAWEAADNSDPDRRGTYSLKAVRKVLADRGTKLKTELARFGVANRHPSESYEEGTAYPVAPVAGSTTLSQARRTQRERVTRLDHLTTKTYAFTPGRGLARGGWRLRVRVDAPAARHSPAVSLTTERIDGTLTTEQLRLNRAGVGRARVSFDSDVVKRVELTLTNAGARFNCNEGTDLSCTGISKSDNRRFSYRVRLTR